MIAARDLPWARRSIHDDWTKLVGFLGERSASQDLGLDPRWELRTLPTADLWAVDDDVTDLSVTLADTYPPDDTLTRELCPTPAGFAFFGHTLTGKDADPHQLDVAGDVMGKGSTALSHLYDAPGSTTGVRYDAVLWGPIQGPYGEGISTSFYRRLDFRAGITNAELGLAVPFLVARGTDPEWLKAIVQMGPHQEPIRLASEYGKGEDPFVDGVMWVNIGRSSWLWGERVDDLDTVIQHVAWDDDGRTIPDPEHVPDNVAQRESIMEDRRRIASLWRLAAMPKVVDQDDAPIDRPERRRMKRAGLDSKVVLTSLRGAHRSQNADAEAGASGRHVSVRYFVKPFWRWQPYGPRRSLRRLQLVQGHVRGPEGAPFKMPDERVFTVDSD